MEILKESNLYSSKLRLLLRLRNLLHRLVTAVNLVTSGHLTHVLQEIVYSFDVCRAKHGAHVKCVQPQRP